MPAQQKAVSKRSAKGKRRSGTSRKGTKPAGRLKESDIQKDTLLDIRFTKAVAHWIRVNILAVASYREISPSEFARGAGLTLSRTSYHFKRLVELDALEPVRQEQVRGAVKTYYRGTRQALFDGSGWTELPKSMQDGVAGAALQDFTKVCVSAFEKGLFSGRDDSHYTWEPLLYDELAFKAMASVLASAREKLIALQDEAAPRLRRTKSEGILVAVGLAGFEMSRDD